MQDNKNENNIKITFAELKHMIAEALVEQLGAAGSPSPDVGEEPLGPEESLEVQALMEKYMGFKKLKKSLAGKGVKDPGAVAASIGRKKYGKEKFQKAAAKGKRLQKESSDPYRTPAAKPKYDHTDERSDEYTFSVAEALKARFLPGVDGLRFVSRAATTTEDISGVNRPLHITLRGASALDDNKGVLTIYVSNAYRPSKVDFIASFSGIDVGIKYVTDIKSHPKVKLSKSFTFEYETPTEEIIERLRTGFVQELRAKIAEAIRVERGYGTDAEYGRLHEQAEPPYSYLDPRSDEYVRYVAGALKDELLSGIDGLQLQSRGAETVEGVNRYVVADKDPIKQGLKVRTIGNVVAGGGLNGKLSFTVGKHQDVDYEADADDFDPDEPSMRLVRDFDGIKVQLMFSARRSKIVHFKYFEFEYETPVEEIVETLRTQFVPLLNQNLEEYIKGPDGDY